VASRLIVRAQDVRDNNGENGVTGEGGHDCRNNPSDENAGEGTIAKATNVQVANATPRRSNSQ
jgi:hypothetical protein